MYGLVQARIIAHKAPKEHLKLYVYSPARITKGLWTHQDRDINFTLVVNYFGIKYMNKNGTDHPIAALQAKYEVSQEWIRGLYCIITLKWNYTAILSYIETKDYVKDTLYKFQNPTPTIMQNLPHQWTAQNYGSTAPQLAHPTDYSTALNIDEAKNYHYVVGHFFTMHTQSTEPCYSH